MSGADLVITALLVGFGYGAVADRHFENVDHAVEVIQRSVPASIVIMIVLMLSGLSVMQNIFVLVWTGMLLGYLHVVIPAIARIREDRRS